MIALLLEMAIANQIQIRIDQPKGLIHLLASEPLASSAPSSKALIGAIDRTYLPPHPACGATLKSVAR